MIGFSATTACCAVRAATIAPMPPRTLQSGIGRLLPGNPQSSPARTKPSRKSKLSGPSIACGGQCNVEYRSRRPRRAESCDQRLCGRLLSSAPSYPVQKGERDNPKGRPKGRRNLKTELRDIALMKVPVRDGDTQRLISLVAANLMAQGVKGAKGDPRSSNLFLNQSAKLGLLDPEDHADNLPGNA